jgi:hypothetical protein
MFISNVESRKTATADERMVHASDRGTFVSSGARNTRVTKRDTVRRVRRQTKTELRDSRTW